MVFHHRSCLGHFIFFFCFVCFAPAGRTSAFGFHDSERVRASRERSRITYPNVCQELKRSLAWSTHYPRTQGVRSCHERHLVGTTCNPMGSFPSRLESRWSPQL
ncbi:hypothetical protein V8E55_002668, partial [Tylopilus felleus]